VNAGSTYSSFPKLQGDDSGFPDAAPIRQKITSGWRANIGDAVIDHRRRP
jgi:hypothetical protein